MKKSYEFPDFTEIKFTVIDSIAVTESRTDPTSPTIFELGPDVLD
ncbi:MAG: hypothetical protein Q8876_08665 [Bacillota bacterium]|nr:hypothetical protein [Bacillota bacterium]